MKNRLLTITNLEQFLRWWPLLRDCYTMLQRKARFNPSVEEFFRAVMWIVGLGAEHGMVLILVNSGGTPLGFVAAYSMIIPVRSARAVIYTMFSKETCGYLDLCSEVDQWARTNGLTMVEFESYRFSGAAIKWLTHKLKFKKSRQVFEKTI